MAQKKYTFEWDTCVEVINVNGEYRINPDGPDEESYFIEKLEESGATYEVVTPEGPGGGWPVIEYTGTKEELAPVMELLNASGYSTKEILDMLEYWDGDEDELLDILG